MGDSLRSEAVNPFCSLGQVTDISEKEKQRITTEQQEIRKKDPIRAETVVKLNERLLILFKADFSLEEIARRINKSLLEASTQFRVSAYGLKNIKDGTKTIQEYFTQTAAEKAIEITDSLNVYWGRKHPSSSTEHNFN